MTEVFNFDRENKNDRIFFFLSQSLPWNLMRHIVKLSPFNWLVKKKKLNQGR
jgi:hypothetical protein